MEGKKHIYMGSSDYKEMACRYCYVDKTLLVKDLLDNRDKVNLITRPRRFGKSLNKSMLQTFFEKTDEDTSVYFRDKKIWKEDKKYTSKQGKYPVICLSFLGANCLTWKMTFNMIEYFISDEYKRHPELETSDKVNENDLKRYNAISSMTADEGDYVTALDTLERMLYKHYGIKPIVLIDEYDAPMQNGYEYGYYDEAENFMKAFFSNGLKDKGDFEFAVLIGVLPVAKGSAYLGFNNPKTFSVLDDELSEDFGFTLDEVKEMLEYYGYGDKLDEVLAWYDGYKFGDKEMFNPFSLASYVDKNCVPKGYWANTSGNEILGNLLENADKDTEEKLVALFQGETISCAVDENVVYSDLDGSDEQIFSILLFSGYLKAVGVAEESEDQNAAYMSVMPDSDSDDGEDGDDEDEDDVVYLLKIPNREVRSIFRKEILKKLQCGKDSLLKDIWSALQRSDAAALEELLRSYLLTAISVYDVGGSEISEDRRANNEYEAFYQGMWLGFAAYKSRSYYIRSNSESGDGRLDLSLEPYNKRYPAMILEFKHLKDKDKSLRDLAKSAISQIDDKNYDADLLDRGCKNIIKVGIAYHGKDVAVAI